MYFRVDSVEHSMTAKRNPTCMPGPASRLTIRFLYTSELLRLLLANGPTVRLFVTGEYLPANSTDVGFQTQSADNLFEHSVFMASAGENRMHLNLGGVLDVVAL